MRNNQEDNLVILTDLVSRTEEITQNRNRAQPGNAAPVVLDLLLLNAARMLASPSRRRIVCSATRWLMIGSVTPLIVTDPLWAVTSILILRVTSRSKCTVGVTSILTPTS